MAPLNMGLIKELHPNLSVEKRTLTKPAGTYVFISTNPNKTPIYNKMPTLLICLHGAGDLATNFAYLWMFLADKNPDVVVAVPEADMSFEQGYTWRMNASDLVTEIIDDTVARDHVNPKHVFLVGHSAGGEEGSVVMGTRPQLFAGYAGLGTAFTRVFFSPTMKQNSTRVAFYYAVGTKDDYFKDAFAPNVAALKKFGITSLLTEQPDCAHIVTFDEMTHMMNFFDKTIKANDQNDAAEAKSIAATAKNLAAEKRTLENLYATYFLLSAERGKTPATGNATLLICLHGAGDSADNFAKSWMYLAGSRSNLVVAVPETYVAVDPSTPGNAWGPDPSDLIRSIIDDTVARDHVNPRRVILVGFAEGGEAGGKVLGEHPDWFAGYAGIATDFPREFLTQSLRKNAGKISLYYAVSGNDEMHGDDYFPALSWLGNFGFANFFTERPYAGHAITPGEISHLLNFFDRALGRNEKRDAVAATVPQK